MLKDRGENIFVIRKIVHCEWELFLICLFLKQNVY